MPELVGPRLCRCDRWSVRYREHTAHARLGRALFENRDLDRLTTADHRLSDRPAHGLDVSGAAWLALWFTVAMLAGAGAYAAALAGARGSQLLIETLVAGSFGLIVIGVKYALH
jgi:hypothetical protein